MTEPYLPGPAHQIGRLMLDVETSNIQSALRLRARVEEIAWNGFPAIVERVVGSVAPADLHLRIDRLSLDLGNIAPENLERDVPVELERALTRALTEVIAGARLAPNAHARALSPAAVLLDDFETYLVHGTVPFRDDVGAAHTAQVIQRLVAEQPGALVAMLRRRAGDRRAIERLVLQAGDAGLRALLGVLAPNDAAIILAYLADLQRLHVQLPAPQLAEPALRRALWVLTLEFLLREAGTQFNRRSFLGTLLEGMAEAEGVEYTELLSMLRTALVATRERQPLGGSLPGVLNELLGELDIADNTGKAIGDDDTTQLARLRDSANDPKSFAALVHGLRLGDFARLIKQAQPRHAAALITDVGALIEAQQRSELVALSKQAFDQLVWANVLRVLLIKADQPVGHPLFWQQLLKDLAQASGSRYTHLLAVLPVPLAALPGAVAAREREALTQLLSSNFDPAVSIAVIQRDPTSVTRWLVQATAAEQVNLIHRVADDPVFLRQVVKELDASSLRALLDALNPAHVHTVRSDLQSLWARHEVEPVLLLDASAFESLSWTLVLATLARRRGKPFQRTHLRRELLAGLARYAGVAAADFGSWRELLAPPAPAHSPMQLVERFLNTGQPQTIGPRISQLATDDPVGFASLVRRLSRAASGKTDTLIERLWAWMLPEEIVSAVRPAQAEQAARWAEMLADMPGANMTSAWRQVLVAVLAGHELGGPAASIWPGRRLDRLALARHWLDSGSLAWWAPPGVSNDTLLADLQSQPLAALQAMLGDSKPAVIVARLRRLHDRLGARAGDAMLKRIAPWAFAAGGPLAALSKGLDKRALTDLRLRAAAAATAGIPFDAAQLPRTVATPPAMPAHAPPPPAPSDRQTLSDWLTGASRPTLTPTAQHWRLMANLLDRKDGEFEGVLRAGLANPVTRARWVSTMPEELLARLLYRLAPARARFMLDLSSVMRVAWRHTAPSGSQAASDRAQWSELLALLAEPQLPSPREIAARVQAALAKGNPLAAERLMTHGQLLADQGGHANILAVLRAAVASGKQAKPPAPASKPTKAKALPAEESEPKVGDVIYVRNAGLVLFNPFLPHLFNYLNVLSKDENDVQRILGVEAASRAVHLLQYLADERCDAREPELVLNKLLCGLDISAPVARSIELSSEDQSICENLIQALLGAWTTISGTSPAGLRETFLQREGRLLRTEDRWTLTVQRKTLDVLVDQIPWSYAVVLHPWMTAPLHVLW